MWIMGTLDMTSDVDIPEFCCFLIHGTPPDITVDWICGLQVNLHLPIHLHHCFVYM